MASEALAAITLKPAAVVVVATLIVALVLSAVLTALLRRATHDTRTTRATPRPAPRAKEQPMRRPITPTAPAAPVDMQDRLRRLTSVYDAPEETVSRIRAPGQGSGPLAPRTTGSLFTPPAPASLAAPPPVPMTPIALPPALATSAQDAGIDDATRFFGDVEAEPDADSTAFFGAEGQLPDSTTFFGAEGELADSTAYFGRQEDVYDATSYFGPPSDSDAGESAPDGQDGTRFFGLADDVEKTETRFFGPLDEQTPSTPPRVAAPADDDADSALTPSLEGQATPPPTLNNEVWDDEGRPISSVRLHGAYDAREQQDVTRPATPDETHSADAEEELMASTGFLAALPPSPPAMPAGVLETMRERLAAVTAPEVLALSVIDGRGRVLAGEADDDLAGELHALMDESGLGETADIEQPVRLSDDSSGVLMLLPTGAGPLLGALLRDAENPGATRDALRGLAHELGDTLRQAS